MRLRKIIVLLFVLLTLTNPASAKAIRVVATIGQITDAVKKIGGERIKLNGLMGPGVDPHLYKASASDVNKLAQADVIFYNGLHLEAKLVNVFKKMSRSKKTVAVAESIPPEYYLDSVDYPGQNDPHVWFDVDLWTKVVEKIFQTLVEMDPEGRSYYEPRAKAYLQEIATIRQYADNRVAELPVEKRVLVTAHDAFRYFGARYNFEVLGLQGISTESEAGIKDVKNLANIIVARKVRAIFVESSVSERNIRAVQEAVRARGWEVKIGGELFSDAMGTAGTPEGTYVGMVRHNINTIVDALKGE